MPLADATSSAVDVFFWVLILVALLLVLATATLWLRRWLKAEEEQSSASAGFTLHDLEQLLGSGKLTQAEYEKLRGEVMAQAKAALLQPRKPPPR